MLVVVQFVGCLVACAAALNLGQFIVWAAAAAVVWAAGAAAVVWAAAAFVLAAAAVVWAVLTACLGTAFAPVHVAV